jgi:hypothetical protein
MLLFRLASERARPHEAQKSQLGRCEGRGSVGEGGAGDYSRVGLVNGTTEQKFIVVVIVVAVVFWGLLGVATSPQKSAQYVVLPGGKRSRRTEPIC